MFSAAICASRDLLLPHEAPRCLLRDFFFASLRADLVKEVQKSGRQDLTGGQTVAKSTDMPGVPWPQLSLYRVVNPTPSVVSNFCIAIANLVSSLKNQAVVEAKNTVLALATEAERRANR